MKTDNESLATILEKLSSDREDFLMAHYLRIGHLDHIEELHKYAHENGCTSSHIVGVILEAAIVNIIGYWDTSTDPREFLKDSTHVFREMMKRAIVVRLLGNKLGGNND